MTGPGERFDWLEGATGVRLALRARGGLRTVVVVGDVDRASVEVIEAVVEEALARSPDRVELDLVGARGRGLRPEASGYPSDEPGG